MRYLIILSLVLLPAVVFGQKKEINQKKIDKQLSILDNEGVFKQDSLGLNGEIIDERADFPGGEEAWRKYLVKNFPQQIIDRAMEKGVLDGVYKIWVELIVNASGEISDVRPLTKFGYGLETGAVKYISDSGPWKPAVSNGKKISSKVKKFMSFSFESE